MTNQEEFDKLAERILHSIILSPRDTGDQSAAKTAVQVADEFLDTLRERHEEVNTIDGLTAEEVALLRNRQAAVCIRSVRRRTDMSFDEAKAHVARMHRQLDES